MPKEISFGYYVAFLAKLQIVDLVLLYCWLDFDLALKNLDLLPLTLLSFVIRSSSRVITKAEGRSLAESMGATYIESTAEDNKVNRSITPIIDLA